MAIEPNPDSEEIDLWPKSWDTGYMIIDQIVVDTMYILEPGMLSPPALGGLVLARRRR